MKKILLSSLVATILASGVYANTQNPTLNIYGAGEKISDKSYNGVGLQYENDFSNIVLEKGSDYSKASGVLKLDINNYFYSKFGIGYLTREILINNANKDVTQKTGGVALGYGDNTNYNLEVGHIVSKLSDALDADGYSRISYIEVLGMYKDFDTVGVYKNTEVFKKNYADYSLDVGYYPIEDIRVSAKYDSVKHDDDNYVAMLGMKYTFDTKKWSPFFKASKNSSENVLVALEWSKKIQNKSLKMRDEFENAISTSEIVAQAVAPDEFSLKTAPAVAISNPTINTIATQSVNDNGGGQATSILTISGTNINTGAVYSIVSDPTSGGLTINSSTGELIYDADVGTNQTYSITVKIVNTDGGNDTETFTLNVTDNF